MFPRYDVLLIVQVCLEYRGSDSEDTPYLPKKITFLIPPKTLSINSVGFVRNIKVRTWKTPPPYLKKVSGIVLIVHVCREYLGSHLEYTPQSPKSIFVPPKRSQHCQEYRGSDSEVVGQTGGERTLVVGSNSCFYLPPAAGSLTKSWDCDLILFLDYIPAIS